MASRVADETLDLDLEALKAKYRHERDKRVRKEGEDQYLEVEADLAAYFEQDPYSDPIERAPLREEIDVVVLGGGFAGLFAGANLRQAGIDDFRIIEMGGDFGGTWYWNRYPGVQCDIESYIYLPLLEQLGYVPKEKYSYGNEIFEHCQRIGQHFGLYDKALFQTMVDSLRWDDDLKRWNLTTHGGDDIRARFLIMASGPYNRAKLPGIPGIESFKGHSFHTSRWDYEYTGGNHDGGLDKLGDKRVAIIGTGATGIQCIPHVGRWAKHLYVFQRTPSAVDERGNQPTNQEWAKSLTPGWAARRTRNFNAVMRGTSTVDLVSDAWTVLGRTIAASVAELPSEEQTLERIMQLREQLEFRHMNRIRDRVDQIVTRPENAEKLKSWYRWMCKRPTFNDDYLPTFNRENVTLVDVSETKGVERITEKGLVAGNVEYEVDCIIYASGFEITTEMKRRIGIPVFEGRSGASLYGYWKDGFKTLHGMSIHGFPNLFFTGFIQGGVSSSVTEMYDHQTRHIAYIISETLRRGFRAVEPSKEAEQSWIRTMRETEVSMKDFLAECTPGYYNNEGGKVMRSHLGEVYGPGFEPFLDLIAAWRDDGELNGMIFEK